MEQIKVVIADKVASVVGTPTIICGNSDYEISFTFDEEWNTEENKVARFTFRINDKKKFIDVPIEEQKCRVPKLIDIALVKVGVYAGDLRTTTGARIRCKKSILCGNAEETEEGMKNLYEKLQGQIKEVDEKTIQRVDNVDLSTCESGVYFTDTIIYKIALIPQPMTEMMPCKALLMVEKTQFGIHFFWLSDAYFIAGMSNENGKFESDFIRYSLENINNAVTKNNLIIDGVGIDRTYSDEQVYNANSINMGFIEFATALEQTISKSDVESVIDFSLGNNKIYNAKAINDTLMTFAEVTTSLDERLSAIEQNPPSSAIQTWFKAETDIQPSATIEEIEG